MGGILEFTVHCGPTTQFNKRWMSSFPTANKTCRKESGAAKQRSGSLSLIHPAELWTHRLECLPFFLGGRNKFQACLCCSKNQLNTKVERRTKTSFTVSLQADNCKDSEHPMHTGTKAGESDNSIYQGLLLPAQRIVLQSRRCWLGEESDSADRWKLFLAGNVVMIFQRRSVSRVILPCDNTSDCPTLIYITQKLKQTNKQKKIQETKGGLHYTPWMHHFIYNMENI